MGSELQVLKKIWENERETSVKLISDQTGLGLDYVRYLCNCLIKRGQIKPVRKKPGWYRITAKGKKKLKLLGIFKPKILKEDKGIKKVILPWPKELLKMRSRPKGARLAQRSWAAKGKEIPVEEKKLRLGKMVEKTISFLKASTFSTKPPHQKFGGGSKGRKRGKKETKGKRKKRALLRPAFTKVSAGKQGYGGQGKRKKYDKR